MYGFYCRAREMDALAQRPNLDTVKEESEEEANGKDKQGQTELHKLAAQEGTGERERERAQTKRERERKESAEQLVDSQNDQECSNSYIFNRCGPDSFAESWVQLG